MFVKPFEQVTQKVLRAKMVVCKTADCVKYPFFSANTKSQVDFFYSLVALFFLFAQINASFVFVPTHSDLSLVYLFQNQTCTFFELIAVIDIGSPLIKVVLDVVLKSLSH